MGGRAGEQAGTVFEIRTFANFANYAPSLDGQGGSRHNDNNW